jgi:hypothetical protein
VSEPAKPGQAENEARPREPYERPAVTWRETLGSMPSLMASCAKMSAADLACNASPPPGS